MADPDDLYQQFNEVYQQRTPGVGVEDGGVLDPAIEFEKLTDAHLKVLMSFKSKRPLPEEDSNICKKLEVMLREERNTWRLARALVKDELLNDHNDDDNSNMTRHSRTNHLDSTIATVISQHSDQMDAESNGGGHNISDENGIHCDQENRKCARYSEDQLIGNFYVNDTEIRRMQLVCDWLEANEASDLSYKDEDDKAEFYKEGPAAWENTLYCLKAKYQIDIPDLDITMNPNAGLELCPAMDPDGPIRTKKSLAHQDKEVEIRLFKHLFRFIRAGKLDEGQDLAERVGHNWLAAILEGWLLYDDPNLGQENIDGIDRIQPISGNKKRDVWKQTCFKAAKMNGLNSCEKAILGVLGGNLKSVLPVCHNWSDQLWARLKCSIDVKIEKALRDPNSILRGRRSLIEFPPEFYANYQSLEGIFKSIREQKVVSPYKEATIHQTIQRYLILNDINGLLQQLANWCTSLDYDTTEGSVSPHFLRCFAHIVLFLRDSNLVNEDDSRATKIIESYIGLLTQHKSIESVAHYSGYLPKQNQTVSFAKLLATINDREERRHCLQVAKESKLDVDDITQTVVELIRDEKQTPSSMFNVSMSSSAAAGSGLNETKTSQFDKRKIDALDYLLLLDSKNYIAILHHGNMLLRLFASQRKMDAVRETFLKLPVRLSENVENQWRVHTNSDITPMLRNNLRELESFRALLEAQEELGQWSEWHHKRPEEPRRPANLSKFCDNVNYEQRMKQYQQDLSVWRDSREVRTNSLTDKISQMLHFPGGWLKDLPTASLESGETINGHNNTNMTDTNDDHSQAASGDVVGGVSQVRLDQLDKLRRHFVPHMITICFNVLQLTQRYEDCLKISHLIVDEELKLYEEFTKAQIREFLDKVSEITKLIVKCGLNACD